jgi:rhodanese-related sulfurtransferase
MTTPSITPRDLRRALESTRAPIVIDVRRQPAFSAARDMIRGALRRDPERVSEWAGALPAGGEVVVYCVHGHQVSQNAAAALRETGLAARYLEGGLEEGWKGAGGALDSKPENANTRWVTRERPKIDRIACPWLIARFVDPGAEFLYAPSNQVDAVAKERNAIPYDVAGVHFTHHGELCSFDAFIQHYRLREPALERLATIVRGADTGRPGLAPESPGLLAISQGLSQNFTDDHEMLKHGMVLYDALYTRCRQD